MWEFIWKQYKKYEEVINYLIFGFLAFIVNMVAYWLAAQAIGADKDHPLLVSIATLIAWVVSVIFAYWTNHTFVFKTKLNGMNELMKEFMSFVGARVVTGILEQIIMFVMTDMMDINDVISKMVCNFIVILCNYIFSKLFIFKKGNKKEEQ